MSYILEALEKSDQERQTHSGLSRPSVQPERNIFPTRRPFWFALLFIALLINAAILVWWIRPWKDKEPEAFRSDTPAEGLIASKPGLQDNRFQQPLPDLSRPSAFLPRPANRYEKSTPPLPEIPDRGRVSLGPPAFLAHPEGKENRLNISPTRPHSASEQTPLQSVLEEEKPRILPTEKPTTELVDTKEELDASPGPPTTSPLTLDKSRSGEAINPLPATPRQPLASRTPGPAVIPDIDQLPASVREKIPILTISFHSYAREPSSRMVSINGHLLREGQAVDEELRLEEIIVDGVIMSYQGERFRKGIFASGAK